MLTVTICGTVHDVGLDLRFEEQLRSQDIVMKRMCIPSIRNSINYCKCCCSGKWHCAHKKSVGFGVSATCMHSSPFAIKSVIASLPRTLTKTCALSITTSFSSLPSGPRDILMGVTHCLNSICFQLI